MFATVKKDAMPFVVVGKLSFTGTQLVLDASARIVTIVLVEEDEEERYHDVGKIF